jgi:hypothetical protein
MSEPSTEIVVPGIGQVVNLEDAHETALALAAVRDLEYRLRDVKKDLSRALVFASEQEGRKTLYLGDELGLRVEIKGGSETVYDAEEIELGLREAGMAETRIREIVVETTSYKVAANEAKKAAAANQRYKAVIDAHTRVEERTPTVSVSKPNV